MRYYNKEDHNEVHFDGEDAPDNLIPADDPRVEQFFHELPEGKLLRIDDDGFPHIEDAPPPAPVNPQNEINAEHRQYLMGTDWMTLRSADGGTAVPPDVLAKRAAARAAIVD